MNTYIRQINGKWYAFEYDGNKVMSIGRDNPRDGRWYASLTDSGIQYVANPSPSYRAAYNKARLHGNYCGII